MDSKNLETLFAEKGFAIKKGEASRFVSQADSVDIVEFLEHLSNLEKKINSSANIVDFAKNILGELYELDNVVNMDEYARLSDTAKFEAYKNDVNAMRERFAKVRNYIRTEENMKFQKQNMFDAARKIYDLDKNQTLDDAKRTSEALRLYSEKKSCEAAYNQAYQTFVEQKKIYEDSIREFNLVDFKNGLLAAINRIQDDCKELALSPESKEKLQVLISNIRNDIAYYGLESIRSKTEFDSLCKRFGIESVGTKAKEEVMAVEEVKSEDINPEYKGSVALNEQLATVEQPKIDEKKVDVEEPVKEEPKVKTSKEKVQEVLAKLQELNPDVEFKLVDEVSGPEFDGRIDASTFITNLQLPEGFYYRSSGISNKFSNATEPVVIEMKELEREKKEDLDTPKIEQSEKPRGHAHEQIEEVENPSLIDKAKNALNKLRQKGRVESGKKYKVTKSRNALIGSYPKSLLTFSAIGAVYGLITSLPVAYTTLGTVGIGAIATAIYRKVTKNTNIKDEEIEKLETEEVTPEKTPGLIQKIRNAGNKLMGVYKQRVSAKKAAREEVVEAPEIVSEPVETKLTSEQQIEKLSRDIEQSLADLQKYQEGIVEEDTPSMGGR